MSEIVVGDNEIYVDNDILIDDVNAMLSILKKQTGRDDIDINKIVDFIDKENATKFYFDKLLKCVNPAETKAEIEYLWLDTGLLDTNNRPIFISLISRGSEYGPFFQGHFVGCSGYLAGTIANYRPKYISQIKENELRFRDKYTKKTASRTQANQPDKAPAVAPQKVVKRPAKEGQAAKRKEYLELTNFPIVEEVQKRLLVQNWKTPHGLGRYLKIIGVRVQQLIEKNKTDYFLLNHIKSAVVNTGLLDKYGSYIYIIYRQHLDFGTYTPYKILETKSDFVTEGFDPKGKVDRLLPVDFFGGETFDATIDDIDITPRALSHIIQERKDRFPESVQKLSDMSLANRVRDAVSVSLRLNCCDSSYIKPDYSGTEAKLGWILPCHIERDITEEPELVLVATKMGRFYEIKTILPYDDSVKDRLTALSLYGRLW